MVKDFNQNHSLKTENTFMTNADTPSLATQNLIENAIKYGDGKRISIDFDKIDGCMTIAVTNTGCTLEEKELTSIFDSFHRGSNAGKTQGNGLGLYICDKTW